MNYADIKTIDIQDGTGVRVSIYVSGCHFHCKGCHNKEAWDFNYGKKFDNSTIDYIIDLMKYDYIAGLSILGGEPLEPSNQKELVSLVQKVKEKYPDKTIWCYTGYDFDKDVLGKMYKEFSYSKDFLNNIDIIVDGEFIEEKKLTNLKFRGSTNQRKIDVKASLKEGRTIQLKFGDEYRYEEKQPKVIVVKEFNKENETEYENSNINIPVAQNNEDNIISITPAYEIRETQIKTAAENINEKNDENL